MLHVATEHGGGLDPREHILALHIQYFRLFFLIFWIVGLLPKLDMAISDMEWKYGKNKKL